MIEDQTRTRRRIKVRGGSLGAYLCWAVVFADIGTSVYYVPGILYGHFGARSAIFVLMTLFVFILLCVKYAEVTWRYPEGGGVVNVSSQALHPFAGLLGGLFILVDYYLTAAISALSGMLYLAIVAPYLLPLVMTVTVVALVGLGILNVLGIKESARTTAIFATIAAAGQLVVVAATAIYLGPSGIIESFRAVMHGPPMNVGLVITGYGAAFLAFSGLESIAQLAPAMREPRRRVSSRAMLGVVVTMAITAPLLTLWSTTLLNSNADPNQFISLLGAHVAGQFLGDYVAISGSVLLVFASNTAIIGAYHVFIALARMGFLPRVLERRNRWRLTPQWAILAAVSLPIVIVIGSGGNVNFLGDLYAFGLLGTFVLTCVSLDVVRWREYRTWSPGRVASYAVGVLTTVLVIAAWLINLVAKPDATKFGGGLTVVGLIIGLDTYRYSRGHRPPRAGEPCSCTAETATPTSTMSCSRSATPGSGTTKPTMRSHGRRCLRASRCRTGASSTSRATCRARWWAMSGGPSIRRRPWSRWRTRTCCLPPPSVACGDTKPTRPRSSTCTRTRSRRSRRALRPDYEVLQLAGIARHHPASGLGDDDRVGVAKPAPPREVHTRLDREHHAGLEDRLVAAVEKRRLVAFEADRMPDVVPQVVGDAQLFGEAQSGQLHLARGDARRHHLDRASLQRQHS